MTQIITLNERHLMALAAIRTGADISSFCLAGTLREIERKCPDLLEIGKRQGIYNGAGHLPYFGAKATHAGRVASKGVRYSDKAFREVADRFPLAR